MKFSSYELKAWLLRSLEEAWYTIATPIQQKVMDIAFTWKSIVWQSQTGTGKTAAFLLPLLNNIDTNKKQLQALILAPTRELATQIGDEIAKLTKYYGVSYACVYGGASEHLQKQRLKKSPAVIVATPWRLKDFINQWIVRLHTVETFVLDEVDRMLDMGFVRDIEKIRKALPNLKQTYTFSATMNDDMKKIINKYVSDYASIKVWEAVTVDKINHSIVHVDHEHKISNVIKLINDHPNEKIVIFTHTKRNTKTLFEIISHGGRKVWMFNGGMSQWKRQRTLDAFKDWQTLILVTTDVAARWLNMDNIALVINFEVPLDAKSYIHRIGRTWRAGKSWKAIMFVSPLEKRLLTDIEREHKTTVPFLDYGVVSDVKWTFAHIKLDRSTDKFGAKRWQWGGWRSKRENYGRGDSQKRVPWENKRDRIKKRGSENNKDRGWERWWERDTGERKFRSGNKSPHNRGGDTKKSNRPVSSWQQRRGRGENSR